MLEPGGDADLAAEPLGPSAAASSGCSTLSATDGGASGRAPDRRSPCPPADLALQRVLRADCCLELVEPLRSRHPGAVL